MDKKAILHQKPSVKYLYERRQYMHIYSMFMITKDKIMLFYAFFFHFIWLFTKYIVILQPLNE